jgi:hypothetical protein
MYTINHCESSIIKREEEEEEREREREAENG